VIINVPFVLLEYKASFSLRMVIVVGKECDRQYWQKQQQHLLLFCFHCSKIVLEPELQVQNCWKLDSVGK